MYIYMYTYVYIYIYICICRCCGLLQILTAELVEKSENCEHVRERLLAAHFGKERETLGDGTIHASQTLGAKGRVGCRPLTLCLSTCNALLLILTFVVVNVDENADHTTQHGEGQNPDGAFDEHVRVVCATAAAKSARAVTRCFRNAFREYAKNGGSRVKDDSEHLLWCTDRDVDEILSHLLIVNGDAVARVWHFVARWCMRG